MDKGRNLTATALALLLAASAQAQDQNALYVRSLAATCAACHGTDGRPVARSPVQTLAGMPQAEVAAQLRAFRSGARTSTIMGQMSKGFSDAQIDQLAAYFSALKP